MKKILCVFTGGTIGSVKVKDESTQRYIIMQPSEAAKKGYENAKSLLLETFKEKNPSYDIDRITSDPVMEELSENMVLSKIDTLINYFKNVDFKKYDGIIITHGTDTLAYTSSIMSYVLAGVSIPVVFVSSNYEVTDPRANGIKNLKTAIDFIDKVGYPGVFATYSFNGVNKIIYGSRIGQCLSIVDDFPYISSQTPVMNPLGTMSDYGDYKVCDYELDFALKYQQLGMEYLKKIGKLPTNVLKIDPYTGLNYDIYNLNNISTILHTCYHSGTACCTQIRANNITDFIKKTQKYDIEFYYGPIYGKDSRDIYSTTKDICDSKAEILMNMTPEAAYAKLIVASALYSKKAERDKFLYSTINNEYINGDNRTLLRKK